MRVLFVLSFLPVCLSMNSCVNPARAPCLKACSQDNDTCMLNATTSDEIQACDQEAGVCGGACPR